MGQPEPRGARALLEAARHKVSDLEGYTPLHMAAWNNAVPDVAAALIEAGADVTAMDNKDGNTPL